MKKVSSFKIVVTLVAALVVSTQLRRLKASGQNLL